MFGRLTSEMAAKFPHFSVPAPAGRERRSLVSDWIALTNPPPNAPRSEGLPRLRQSRPKAPTEEELANSARRVAERYGREVTFSDLRGRLRGTDVDENCQRPHQIRHLGREPAACVSAATDCRLVGASTLDVAADFALLVEDRPGHSGMGKPRCRSAERMIHDGDELQWLRGIWPWAVMDSAGEIPLRWEWWSDPRCLEAFRTWWAEGWVRTLDAEAELAWHRRNTFGHSLDELGWRGDGPA